MAPNATDPARSLQPSQEELVRLRRFLIAAAGLLVFFSLPLYHLVRFSLSSELYSFIIIIPFISGYLAWSDRDRLFPGGAPVSRAWTGLLGLAGLGLLIWAALVHSSHSKHAHVDSLALSMYALVMLLAACATHLLGRNSLRQLAFPLGFLVFLAPFPVAVETGFETLLQHGSSWTAHRFFDVARMPVFRDGTFFQLPGFSMQVAPECSGIRSTLALFLTSLVAGQMFLRSPWRRTVLAAVVLPIALVRNGFRVFVIGELCVQVGPHMIHSWIHRHGGPVFFALSLIPFSLILFYLYKTDRRTSRAVSTAP